MPDQPERLSALHTLRRGVSDFKIAHRLVWDQKIWRMLAVPGLLSVLYWPAAFYLTYRGLHLATDFWIGRTESRWLVITGVIVLGLILGGSMLAGAILLHRAFIMTVCAPIWGPVSELAERALLGTTGPPLSIRQMARDIRRAIFVTTILVALSAFIFIGCWVLTFVPIVQVAAIVFLPFAQMFLAGAGFVDPVLERRKLSVRETFHYIWAHRWRMVGNGCGYTLLLLFPIVGWFLAPGYAVVAATVGAVRDEQPGETLPELQ